MNEQAFQQETINSLRWYAVHTKHHHEKKIASHFSFLHIESYLPLSLSLRQWRDRKKWLEMPVFPCYVFVNCRINEKMKIINTMKGVVSLVGRPYPESIPDYQIDAIKKVLIGSPGYEHITGITPGEEVLIMRGPLKGVRGKLLEFRNKNLLIVQVDLINQGISTLVDKKDVIQFKRGRPLPCSVINYEMEE